MAINQSILQEFEREAAVTRKVLSRVPDAAFGWKPHEKSMTMGALSNHLARLTEFGLVTLNTESIDVAGRPSTGLDTIAEILTKFDMDVAALRQGLQGASDEALMQTWTLRFGEQVMFAMPRVAVLRSMILNHSIHHRGQLSVYLRMNDVPVPSIYGPSADERN